MLLAIRRCRTEYERRISSVAHAENVEREQTPPIDVQFLVTFSKTLENIFVSKCLQLQWHFVADHRAECPCCLMALYKSIYKHNYNNYYAQQDS